MNTVERLAAEEKWRPELERILDWETHLPTNDYVAECEHKQLFKKKDQAYHINLEHDHNLNLESLKVFINMSLEWCVSDVASREWRMMLLFEME